MKIPNKISDYASIILTALLIIAMLIVMCVTIDVNVDFSTKEFWVQFATGVLVQLLMVALWLPEGKKRGTENEKYKSVQKVANDKMTAVAKPELFADLDAFCKVATEENIIAYITRKVQAFDVNYMLWGDEKYRGKFSNKIRVKVAKIESKARRTVRPINPTEITTTVKVSLRYDVTNHEQAHERLAVLFKGLTSAITPIIPVMLSVTASVSVLDIVVKLLYWLGITASAIFFSMHTGIKLVTQTRRDYYLRVIDFLDRFEGWKLKNEGTK